MRSSSRPHRRPLPIHQSSQGQLPFLVEPENAFDPVQTDLGSEAPAQHSVHEPLANQHAEVPTAGRRKKRHEKGKPPAKASLSPQAKLLVSREEAAQMLSISVRGVDYLIATKRLSTRRIGARVLIPIEDVRKFARSDHPERLAG